MSDMEKAESLIETIKGKIELLVSLSHLEEGIKPDDIIKMCGLVTDIANLHINKLNIQPFEDEEFQELMVEYYADVINEAETLADEIRNNDDIDDDDLADYVEELQGCFEMLQEEPPPSEPPESEIPPSEAPS